MPTTRHTAHSPGRHPRPPTPRGSVMAESVALAVLLLSVFAIAFLDGSGGGQR
jgi:hypothetical protein